MPRKLFKPGQSGNPGGVPKGGGKAKKARLKVQEILDMENFEPFREVIKLIRTTRRDAVKADLLMDLCSYIAPKLKHIEISSDSENPFIVNLNFSSTQKSSAEKITGVMTLEG